MPALKRFRAKLDPRKVNGAVLLGLNGVVVKSHGGTDRVGFCAGHPRSAAEMGESRFQAEIEESLKRLMASGAAPAGGCGQPRSGQIDMTKSDEALT